MHVPAYLTRLELHGVAMADAAACAGLDTSVPTCPGWTVRDLLAHTGMVHRWAAAHVREGMAASSAADHPAPGDEQVVDWFRAGHAELVAALRAAPDDLEAMRFLADAGPAREFWARRQAHETAVHRADAEAANATSARFDADLDVDFALDGIAELLEGFFGRPSRRMRADPPVRLRVQPDGSSVSWLVELRPDGKTITRHSDPGTLPIAGCTLGGTPAQLYRFLWNRGGDVRVDGDRCVLDVWAAVAKVQWS